MTETVSLKEHFDALRASDSRAIELTREYMLEKFETHNGILKEWRDATAKDRDNFARKETVSELAKAFDIYKEITAKALTLAEGKSKGFDIVKGGTTFIAGLVVAGVTMWAALKGVG